MILAHLKLIKAELLNMKLIKIKFLITTKFYENDKYEISKYY